MHTILEQLQRRQALLLIGFIPSVLLLLLLTLQQDIPLQLLTRDSAAISKLPTYTGLVSNLGFLVWGAGITICIFTALVLRGRGGWGRFFLASAGVTLLLLLDDMFMIHERVLPSLGITESVYYFFYPLLVVIYAVACWRWLRQTDFVLVLIALALLGSSMSVDFAYPLILQVYHGVAGAPAETAELDQPEAALAPPSTDTVSATTPAQLVTPDKEPVSLAQNVFYLAEDGTKFWGIVGWLLYLIAVARSQIERAFEVKNPLK